MDGIGEPDVQLLGARGRAEGSGDRRARYGELD